MNRYRLENWRVVHEFDTPKLAGNVYDHDEHEDGKTILTSHIIHGEGNLVYTRNSVYILGDPDPDYVLWCKENGHHIPTKEQPIKWDHEKKE